MDKMSDAIRTGTIQRDTTETKIALTLNLDGQGTYSVSTGIRFFDHMLELFTRHGAFDLAINAPAISTSISTTRWRMSASRSARPSQCARRQEGHHARGLLRVDDGRDAGRRRGGPQRTVACVSTTR